MAHKGSIANLRGFAMTLMNVIITEGNVDICLSKLHHAFEVEACDQLWRLLCA
jgi:hypothetical protein